MLVFLIIIVSCFTYGSSLDNQSPEYVRVASSNVTINEGQSQVIPCIIKDMGSRICAWNRGFNGTYGVARTFVNSDGQCSLNITEASVGKDEGRWGCQILPGSDGSSLPPIPPSIHITVLSKPKAIDFIDKTGLILKNQLVVTADAMPDEIDCRVQGGNPCPTIEWYLGNDRVTDFSTIVQPVELCYEKDLVSRLKMNFTRDDNKKTLTCHATVHDYKIDTQISLDVQYAPVLRVPTTEVNVREGGIVNVPCEVDANPPAVPFWVVKSSQQQSLNPNLVIENITRGYNGATYTCRASNAIAKVESPAVTIMVQYKPTILDMEVPKDLEVGADTTLSCRADGNPQPSIEWYLIDPYNGAETVLENPSNPTNFYKISNATYDDEGIYLCRGVNYIDGEPLYADSKKLALNIKGQPGFLSKSPQTFQGNRGEQSRINLNFCSNSKPDSVSWVFGPVTIDVSDKEPVKKMRYTALPYEKLETIDQTLDSSIFNCYRATLVIEKTDVSDARMFELVVTNKNGSASKSIVLQVLKPLSAGVVVAIVLSIILLLFAVLALYLFVSNARRRRTDKVADIENKEDAQALSQAISASNLESVRTVPDEKVNEEQL